MTRFLEVLKPFVLTTALFVGVVYLLAFTSQTTARHRFDSVCPAIGTRISIHLPNRAIIVAEISCRPHELSTGFRNRDRLPDNRGMLFIYQRSGHHPHWMYNCSLPLGMVGLDSAGRVLEIQNNAPPCQSSIPFACPLYGTTKQTKYVLELNAGTAISAGLKVHDLLHFSVPGKKS